MYIEHKEYLALLDQIDYLKKDNLLLKEQNAILAMQLSKEQQKRLQQEEDHVRSMKAVEELHAKAIAYEVEQKQQIMERISQMETQTKQYLDSKFTHLENSSFTQVKSIELENAKTKLNYYELVQFVNKLRVLYHITSGTEPGKGKKEASLMDLLKWIKSVPGVDVSLTKSNLSPSMINLSASMSNFSTSMSNFKKQTNKSLFKENRSSLNTPNPKQKSRVQQ